MRTLVAAAALAAMSALATPAAFAQTAELNDAAAESADVSAPREAWWTVMNDPTLDRLVREALAKNPGLAAARDAVREQRATASAALSPALPSVSVDLAATRTDVDPEGERESFAGASGASGAAAASAFSSSVPYSTESGSAYLAARWNVDVFGSTIRNSAALGRAADAALETRDERAASTALAVALAWYDLLAARMQAGAIETQITANEQMLELVQLRFERAAGSGLDVLQQRQQLAATATQRPAARARVVEAEAVLVELLGGAIDHAPGADALPEPPPAPEYGAPDDLLDNRPDLRAATQNVESARLARGGAIAGFLPTFALTARAGQRQPDFADDYYENVWEAGAVVSIPIFDGGGNVADLQRTSARLSAARHQRASLALAARREVEVAAARSRELAAQREAYRAQLAAADAALEQSRYRYVNGLADYQAVLTALGARQQAELGLIETHRQLIAARLALYDALGGAWTKNIGEEG